MVFSLFNCRLLLLNIVFEVLVNEIRYEKEIKRLIIWNEKIVLLFVVYRICKFRKFRRINEKLLE